MTWNYRRFKQRGSTKVFDKNGKNLPVPDLYFIAECYYDENGKPELHSTMEHNLLAGETPKELVEVFDMVKEAFDAPIIELNEDGDFEEVAPE